MPDFAVHKIEFGEACLSFGLVGCLFACLRVCVFLCLSLSLSLFSPPALQYVRACLSAYLLSIHPSVSCLSTCISIYFSICLPTCLAGSRQIGKLG